MVEDLDWTSASIETPRGQVSCSWKKKAGAVGMDVVIPANSDATIVVPSEEEMTAVTVREGNHVVWQNGKFVPGDPGITNAKSRDGAIEFSAGSGYYQFLLTGE
jgi:alpha-L-rhamnosidase